MSQSTNENRGETLFEFPLFAWLICFADRGQRYGKRARAPRIRRVRRIVGGENVGPRRYGRLRSL